MVDELPERTEKTVSDSATSHFAPGGIAKKSKKRNKIKWKVQFKSTKILFDDILKKQTDRSVIETLKSEPANAIENNVQKEREIPNTPKKDVKEYICDICDRVSPTWLSLSAHIQLSHPKNFVACEVCGRVFKATAHLNNHLKSHNIEPMTKDKTHGCRICQIKFETMKEFVDHQKCHNTSQAFPCILCDKSFVCKSSVNRHIMKTHLAIMNKQTNTYDTNDNLVIN